MTFQTRLVGGSLLLSLFAMNESARAADFVGSRTCAACHEAIAKTQAKSAMALTWRGDKTDLLPAALAVQRRASDSADAPVFGIVRTANKVEVSWANAAKSKTSAPVEVVIGGQRHGLSFLARMNELDGMPLARPVLVESRFAWSTPKQQLVLSPGFSADEPITLDIALGRALSPTLEAKCMNCHGKPESIETGASGGVHCESCHGPGSNHVLAAGRSKPHDAIINPARLDSDARMAVCARCHTGFSRQSDPLPDDLLVSNQVNALSQSECFIQSGKKVGCTSCHDPHDSTTNVQTATVKACLSCHSGSAESKGPHAAECPVSARGECVGCHMPSIDKGSFHMVDHWIRVHPEQFAKTGPRVGYPSPVQSQVRPLREFIRLISVPNRDEAEAARARLSGGDSFFRVARETSKDITAPIGGYLGAMWLSDLDPRLSDAAGTLAYGQISPPVDMGDHWIIIQRLPRDFKYEAEQLFEQAALRRNKNDTKGALEKYQQALIVYPNFLRALVGMGTALAESGNLTAAAAALSYAVQTYPEDSDAEFNFGITLGGLGRHEEELTAYRRALELNPDQDAVYENLGAACFASGDSRGAAEAFRKGLQVDPLSAVLYYDLSLVLDQAGDKSAAGKALALAVKIDPRIEKRRLPAPSPTN